MRTRAAVKLVPPGSTLEIVDLDGIPPFNEDHEKEFPQAAREFNLKVSAPNGPVQRSVNRTLKKALDPNGILAPGKSGIR